MSAASVDSMANSNQLQFNLDQPPSIKNMESVCKKPSVIMVHKFPSVGTVEPSENDRSSTPQIIESATLQTQSSHSLSPSTHYRLSTAVTLAKRDLKNKKLMELAKELGLVKEVKKPSPEKSSKVKTGNKSAKSKSKLKPVGKQMSKTKVPPSAVRVESATINRNYSSSVGEPVRPHSPPTRDTDDCSSTNVKEETLMDDLRRCHCQLYQQLDYIRAALKSTIHKVTTHVSPRKSSGPSLFMVDKDEGAIRRRMRMDEHTTRASRTLYFLRRQVHDIQRDFHLKSQSATVVTEDRPKAVTRMISTLRGAVRCIQTHVTSIQDLVPTDGIIMDLGDLLSFNKQLLELLPKLDDSESCLDYVSESNMIIDVITGLNNTLIHKITAKFSKRKKKTSKSPEKLLKKVMKQAAGKVVTKNRSVIWSPSVERNHSSSCLKKSIIKHVKKETSRERCDRIQSAINAAMSERSSASRHAAESKDCETAVSRESRSRENRSQGSRPASAMSHGKGSQNRSNGSRPASALSNKGSQSRSPGSRPQSALSRSPGSRPASGMSNKGSQSRSYVSRPVSAMSNNESMRSSQSRSPSVERSNCRSRLQKRGSRSQSHESRNRSKSRSVSRDRSQARSSSLTRISAPTISSSNRSINESQSYGSSKHPWIPSGAYSQPAVVSDDVIDHTHCRTHSLTDLTCEKCDHTQQSRHHTHSHNIPSILKKPCDHRDRALIQRYRGHHTLNHGDDQVDDLFDQLARDSLTNMNRADDIIKDTSNYSLVQEPCLVNMLYRLDQIQAERDTIRTKWNSVSFDLPTKPIKPIHPIIRVPTPTPTHDQEDTDSIDEERPPMLLDNLFHSLPQIINPPSAESLIFTTKSDSKSSLPYMARSDSNHSRPSSPYMARPSPLVKTTTHLSLPAESVANIRQYAAHYTDYLKKSSHQPEGIFDPWSLIQQVCDDIVNDCIYDISTEVDKLSGSFVDRVCKSEFAVPKLNNSITV